MLTFFTSLNSFAQGSSRRPQQEIFSIPTTTTDIHGLRLQNKGGEPVILLAGFFSDNTSWDSFAIELWAMGFDVWIPNMRGQGKGPLFTPPGPYGSNSYDNSAAEDIPVVIESIYSWTQKKIHLVGFSFGGMYAKLFTSGVVRQADGHIGIDLNTKARRASQLKSLTLIATPINPFNWPQPFRWMGPRAAELSLLTGIGFSVTQEIREDAVRNDQQGYKSRDGFDYAQAQRGYDLVRTLIVVGEYDFLASKKESLQEAQNVNHGFQLLEIKGTHHANFFKNNAPIVLADRVTEFLQAPETYTAPTGSVGKYNLMDVSDQKLKDLVTHWKLRASCLALSLGQ